MQVHGEGGIRVGAGVDGAIIIIIMGIMIPWVIVSCCSRS
jgi:hypothetical protein